MLKLLSSYKINVAGGMIAAWSIGEGDDIIFLHGGPGDTHNYMKRMAEPLFDKYRCIFFDQRGTGESNTFERYEDNFKIDFLFEDLLCVKHFFKSNAPILVGHSWGAMYAFFSCLKFPTEFRKAALISMGPLDSEMNNATGANLLSSLSEVEKEEWRKLRSERNLFLEKLDFNSVLKLDKEMMKLRVKAWVFNPSLHDQFLKDYFRDPPLDREVNKWIWKSVENWFSWSKLINNDTEFWLCVGENDSVPIQQTQRIVENLSRANSSIYKNCGHIPWLEHKDLFYRELRDFLS